MLKLPALVQGFYRGWDPSFAGSTLNALAQGRGPEAIGEGTFFSCYPLRAADPRDLKTVLLLAKPSFYRQGPRYLEAWRQAMLRMRSLEHPLLPPFELLESPKGQVAYGMPYLAQALGSEAQRHPSFDRQRCELEALFAAKGLHLGDLWQFRLWQGQPLLCDFSDLTLV